MIDLAVNILPEEAFCGPVTQSFLTPHWGGTRGEPLRDIRGCVMFGIGFVLTVPSEYQANISVVQTNSLPLLFSRKLMVKHCY